MAVQIPNEIIDQIKAQAIATVGTYAKQATMYRRYREVYFMDNVEKPKNQSVDEGDFKITPSPNGRNAVIGMQRLLNTSEMNVKVDEEGAVSGNSDKIEAALKKILAISGEGRRARIESDAMLSAVLYGPVILYAESIADLLTVKGIKEYRRLHLQKLQKRTPFIIRTINPEESVIEREDGMVSLHVWKTAVLGSRLKAKWGVECDKNTTYNLYDVFTPEYHIVWAEGVKGVLFAGEHKLGCVPVFQSIAGGSELFHKPEEYINSFLYAKVKGEFDKRENSVLTTIFTNVHMRGLLGQLISVDPNETPDNIEISHQGGIRIIKAKAQPIDDKVIDPTIMRVKDLLDSLDGESTIYKQTLGGNSGGPDTFSGLAMLASSGKLPMTDSQRALESAFKDCFEYMLYRIKAEGIENPLIEPAEIPESYEINVTFKPKLPQDSLRNAQIAQSLGGLVSDEWKHSELMQIDDTPAMNKQMMKERITATLLEAMLQKPEFMEGMIAKVLGQPQQPPAQPQQTPQPDPMQSDPNAMMMQEQAMAGQMGGDLMAGGQPNMEAMPQTDPMRTPMERM